MTTANRGINVYITPALEKSLTQHCSEYDITRKDKAGQVVPAWGTAVLEILKQHFSGDVPSNVPSNVSSSLPDDLDTRIEATATQLIDTCIDKRIEAITQEIRSDLVPQFNETIKVNQEQLREELLGRIEALERLAIAPKLEEVEAATVNEKIPSAPLEPSTDKIDAIATPPATTSDDVESAEIGAELLTATQMSKLFPGVGSQANPAQRFRDWAKRGNGKAELSGLGYQAIAQLDGKGKTNYFFQAIVIE